MASVQQFLIGFMLLIVACSTGFFLSYVGGNLIEQFYNNGTALGPPTLIDSIDDTNFYKQTNGIGIDWKINLFYAMCYLCPLLGVAWFWQSLIKYQSYDTYGQYGANAPQQSAGRGRFRRRRR